MSRLTFAYIAVTPQRAWQQFVTVCHALDHDWRWRSFQAV